MFASIKRMREEKSAFLPWKTPWNREGEKEKIVENVNSRP